MIEAPALVFHSQEELSEAFRAGELDRDFVAVVRFQGPKANGMPELHKLTPTLGVLQDRGYKVALVTDGRMSGASGKVPAAIHVTPEAAEGGADRARSATATSSASTRRAVRWRCSSTRRLRRARGGDRRPLGQRARHRPRAVPHVPRERPAGGTGGRGAVGGASPARR